MPITVSASRHIDAAPRRVYGIIADYRNGHSRILPKRYFGDLVVEEGGAGAGTRIRFQMKGFGSPRVLTAEIEEPEPGRVLVERYPETGGITRFIVDPDEAGSTVTIQTEWTPRGLQALLECLLAPAFLRKVYREELDLLRAVAESSGQVADRDGGGATPEDVPPMTSA